MPPEGVLIVSYSRVPRHLLWTLPRGRDRINYGRALGATFGLGRLCSVQGLGAACLQTGCGGQSEARSDELGDFAHSLRGLWNDAGV